MNDTSCLSHTKWNCKYHIVFAPKYRRQAIYSKIKADIGKIIRKLCEVKKGRDFGSERLPRPYSPIGKNTAKYKCCTVYGVSQGQEFADDI